MMYPEFLEETDGLWHRLDPVPMLFGNNQWLLLYFPVDNGYIPNRSKEVRNEDFSSNHFQIRFQLAANHFAPGIVSLCAGNIAKSVAEA